MMGLFNTLGFIARHPLSKGRMARHPLSKGRRAENVAWFLSWQIGSRLVPGAVAVDFVNDAKLLARPGMTGATGNVYVGLHEFADMGFVLHALRPAEFFVDVGANIGSYTILAAAGIGAKVVAFEPDGTAFDWLTKNIGLNGVGALVEARQEAVGDKVGALRMTLGQDTVNHVLTSKREASSSESPSQDVRVTTLDVAPADRTPIVMKIDVEGFETAVVAGGCQTFEDPGLRAVLMELIGGGNRYGYDEEALRLRMLGWDFHRFRSPSLSSLGTAGGSNRPYICMSVESHQAGFEYTSWHAF